MFHVHRLRRRTGNTCTTCNDFHCVFSERFTCEGQKRKLLTVTGNPAGNARDKRQSYIIMGMQYTETKCGTS